VQVSSGSDPHLMALLRAIRLRLAAPEAAAAKAPRGGLAPWRLRRATEWLEAHMADDARLADLAAAVGLSERHLCTAFRVSTGRPPHRWLLERRVERAKALLAAATGGAPSVTEVAMACGFSSSAHFATMFRRATGKTPTAWRGSAAPAFGYAGEWVPTGAREDAG
jgi:transcriptional regulator GlxA family with amidase domain